MTGVQTCALPIWDSGLALSANDYQLIAEWEERKVPVGLACRAIESGYSQIISQGGGRHGNISLTQLKVIVEEEIQAGFRRN